MINYITQLQLYHAATEKSTINKIVVPCAIFKCQENGGQGIEGEERVTACIN